VTRSASCQGTPSTTIEKTPALLEKLRVVEHPLGVVEIAALHAVPAELVHRLGRETDVSHHGNGRIDNRSHRSFDATGALDLHRFGSALFHQPARAAHGVCGCCLVAHERQIADHECAGARARHGLQVMHHLVDGDGQRVLVTQDHVSDAVADQDHLDARFVLEARSGKIVRGQHHDFLTATLHLLQRLHRDFAHRFSHEGT
jgi:hypothetical protein